MAERSRFPASSSRSGGGNQRWTGQAPTQIGRSILIEEFAPAIHGARDFSFYFFIFCYKFCCIIFVQKFFLFFQNFCS
jgi:hypothetical protein